jgi:hypothetical protein
MDTKESNYVLSELGKLLTDVMDLDPDFNHLSPDNEEDIKNQAWMRLRNIAQALKES